MGKPSLGHVSLNIVPIPPTSNALESLFKMQISEFLPRPRGCCAESEIHTAVKSTLVQVL